MSIVIPPEIIASINEKKNEKRSMLNNIIIMGVFGFIIAIAIYFTFIRYKLIGRAIENHETGIAFGLASPEIASSVSALLRI